MNPKTLFAAALTLFGGYYVMSWLLGGSSGAYVAEGDSSKKSREENARIIDAVLSSFGYSRPVIVAAIANAIRESNLDNTARGDNGESTGVFQIRDRDYVNGKLVMRQFEGSREDTAYAARWIHENELSTERARPVIEAAGAGDYGLAASLFMQLVERPAERSTGGANWREAADIAMQVKDGKLPNSWQYDY